MDKINDFNSLFDKYATAAISAADAAINKYGQQAVDLGLLYVKIDILYSLIFAIVCLISGIITTLILIKKRTKIWKMLDDSGGAALFLFIPLWLFCLVSIISATLTLTNPWYYVGLLNPEVYIVKQVIETTKNK